MDERFALHATNASAVSASAQMDFDVLNDGEMVNASTLLAVAPAEAGQ
jgi:hypothetical protein